MCLSETAAILVLLLLEESLSDMAGHPPGSNCLMPVSEQTCSEPLSPDVHLPPSAASCPVYFGGYNFPSSTALLDSLSSPYPQTFPSLPPSVPASLKPVPALQSTAGEVCPCTAVMMLLGLPQSFLARIWLISFSGKHGGPGNRFWQLVSCLLSVHLCHG